MAAEIELQDGTPAIYTGTEWLCPDPKAVPMLEYFTEQVFNEVYESDLPNICAGVARRVVAKIVGAKLVRYDAVKNSPGAIY